FRDRNHFFLHGGLTGAVNGDRGCEDKTLHSIIDARIDQVHGTDEIVIVVEPLNEMTEAFGSVSSEMVHIVKSMLSEEAIDKIYVEDRTLDEDRTLGNIVEETAAEVVQHNDFVAIVEQPLDDVRTHETGSAGYQ